ncbi:ATPase [Alistipes sp.]|uniref:ATPase n=1 Tax=Alistipes sp. TaxID=1872444 RepID=UPI0025B8252F|nr:ATPase [Alistipes sp.]
MILIADSGSTKTDWCVAEKGEILHRIITRGMNPFFQTEEEMKQEICHTLLPQLPDGGFDTVYFYGAGCTPEKGEQVHKAVSTIPGIRGEILVASDMLGAARGLCGHHAGIACILGTGSNSCHFDGERITANVSPLGFILGDEGSGAVLGKLLVGSLLKNQMTEGLKEEFLREYDLTPAEIIARVYRQPFPNRFLASLSPFLARHLDDKTVYALVLESFEAFFRRNIMQYDYRNCEVHFIGSVAHYYRAPLEEAARRMGIRLGRIVQSPMEGLVAYHNA